MICLLLSCNCSINTIVNWTLVVVCSSSWWCPIYYSNFSSIWIVTDYTTGLINPSCFWSSCQMNCTSWIIICFWLCWANQFLVNRTLSYNTNSKCILTSRKCCCNIFISTDINGQWICTPQSITSPSWKNISLSWWSCYWNIRVFIVSASRYIYTSSFRTSNC